MKWRPKKELSESEVSSGLRLVIYDGLSTEAMTSLTGGAFLVAMAVLLGASNFQIGLLTALPMFTNIFQLLSIWLVRRYNNRRAVTVICSVLARLPLLAVGLIILLTPRDSFNVLIFFLFFHFFFGSVAGPAWNSWMKDLVPEKKLGTYFSQRGSYTQTVNVVFSLAIAFLLDFIKHNYPDQELTTYAIMFIVGSISGLAGAWFLFKTPEPQSILIQDNIFRLFKRPLHNTNFRKLLIFNSAWALALNLATPFFTVFLLKSMQLPLSYIIALNVLSQVSSILTIRIWGRFADRYSNKTIIAIAAPLYILCIIAWCFVGIYSRFYANLALLAGIFLVSGFSTAGINLALTNIGLKLAPRDEAIVYLSVKNIITSSFSFMAPLIGGLLADYFTKRHISIRAEWGGPALTKVVRLLELHDWNFLFAIAAILAFFALEFLVPVKEVGEVEKNEVVRVIRSNIKNNLKEAFVIGQLLTWHEQFWGLFRRKKTAGRKSSPT